MNFDQTPPTLILTEARAKSLPARIGVAESTVIKTVLEPASSSCSESIEGARLGKDDAACLVNHNFPICRRVPSLPSFPTMRPRSPRPRAADDFAVIRARMEELRRERAQAATDNEQFPAAGPRPYAISSRPALGSKRNLQAVMRRLMAR